MGAYTRENRIELMVDVNEFYDRVRIVFPHTELAQLGLQAGLQCPCFQGRHAATSTALNPRCLSRTRKNLHCTNRTMPTS